MGLIFIIGAICASIILMAKKNFKIFISLPIIFILALLIYLPVNKNSGGLIFTPFWVTRDFIVQPGLKLSNLELAREVYASHFNFLQGLRMDLTIFLIFMLAQFGVKNIAFIFSKSLVKTISLPTTIFIYSGISSGLILATFFIQQSGGANSFNFFLAASTFMSIPAAFILGKYLSKKFILGLMIFLAIFTLTLPRWIYRTENVLSSYFKQTTPVVNSAELQAMDYIEKNTKQEDVVLVFNSGTWDSLYPYVSAFTQRNMFLSGQGILKSHVIDYRIRENIVNSIKDTKDAGFIEEIMKKNKIKILYFFGKPGLKADLKNSKLKKIFQNQSVTLLEL